MKPSIACLHCEAPMRDEPRCRFASRHGDAIIAFIMPGLRCDACGFQTVRGPDFDEFRKRFREAKARVLGDAPAPPSIADRESRYRAVMKYDARLREAQTRVVTEDEEI